MLSLYIFIWGLACRRVVRIYLTNNRRKRESTESIRMVDFQGRLDILLEKRLSGIAGPRYKRLYGKSRIKET
jgi:hypothetical protein